MAERCLHVVSFDVPFPADYGGVFDVYYKLAALHEAGFKVKLHCYEYGRGKQAALNSLCKEVYYYERKNMLSSLAPKLPYIVSSRGSAALLQRLLADDDPVLFEGIHTTLFLYNDQLPPRRCFVRLHNAEHIYYEKLHKTSQSFVKRLYYRHESNLLLQYEKAMANRATFFPITHADAQVFSRQLGYTNLYTIPAFIMPLRTEMQEGMGSFCLYHGNLSVPENDYAALWLIREVFADSSTPLVIAGKQPSPQLQQAVYKHKHICLVSDPANEELEELIKLAQVHVLPSFNSTGVKLKLLHALAAGRHCVVNAEAVHGTGLEELCIIAHSAGEMQMRINKFYTHPFNSEDHEQRLRVLNKIYNNRENARRLVEVIFAGQEHQAEYSLALS